jgi:RNA polymerase sigma-70 factor (ECF subfamily)
VYSSPEQTVKRFEETIVPWLGAAFRLARWLTGNRHDAEDVVQEACLRAFRNLEDLGPGADARAWLLAIVRNASCDCLRRNRNYVPLVEILRSGGSPETLSMRRSNVRALRARIAELTPELREVIELRGIKGLSYREIAKTIDAPLGTVMSRLSRGRRALREFVTRL